jgi:hypothetical protein
MNRYQFVSNNKSSKNTHVKSEINKLSTNIRCHFLEITVPINETSKQFTPVAWDILGAQVFQLENERVTQLTIRLSRA